MPSRLDIHETAVMRYITPGGEVADLLDGVAFDAYTYSKGYVAAGHVRSGRLLRSIYYNKTKTTGPLTGFSRVGASARHTEYFHNGTTGPITGRPNLIVPKMRGVPHTNTAYRGAGAQLYAEWAKGNKKNRRGKGVFRPNAVSGQRAKPFLVQGRDIGLAKHGLK